MGRPDLSFDQRVAWLRLARSARIGPTTFLNFINRYGSADAALEALPDINARAGGTRPLRICSREEALRELEEADHLTIRHITYGEAQYPELLMHISDSPPIVLVQGSLDLNARPMLALVGSRNASVSGQKMASLLARDVGEQGYVTVSGLARGIDTAVHKASLTSGTVAVLAGGHGRVYPPENIDLARDIVEAGGAVMSERRIHSEPRSKDFPRRNRIVSGLALGVVVVEAARRSGSLITARLAGEQGRQVFAVPGSPLDPRSDGANDLLRQGATLIRSADDILSDLRPMIEPDGTSPNEQTPFRFEARSNNDGFDAQHPPEDALHAILNGLSVTPTHVDDIIRFTGLPASVVLSSLCELEFSGRIDRVEGNCVVRTT
ncbi:MAG: DNA-processing protein DprA [Pseudomonadota bacterium]